MKEAHKKRNQAGLFLPNRKVSWVITTALFLCFIMFSLGYFWGQRRAVSSFLGKIEEESFADKITYSLYAMNGRDASDEDDSSDDNDSEELTTQEETAGQEQSEDIAENTLQDLKPIVALTVSEKISDKVYVAPLVGFGTLHAAQSFASRVKKIGIDVLIKDRKSTTSKGKKVTWYQAVSHEYDTKEELQSMIDLLQKKENIKEIKIIEKKKG